MASRALVPAGRQSAAEDDVASIGGVRPGGYDPRVLDRAGDGTGGRLRHLRYVLHRTAR
jgi:hypothetical protein